MDDQDKLPAAKRVKLDPRKTSMNSRLSRCRDWLEDQGQLKKSRQSDMLGTDDESSSETESQLPQDDYDEAAYSKLQRRLRKQNINEQTIQVTCEWKSCKFSTEKYSEFQLHVRKHISQVDVKSYNGSESLYACLWEMCGFETNNDKEIIRHINFHAYHSRIKAVGVNVNDRFCLERCSRDSSQKNQLPEIPN